jgi:hypothetical protein
MMRKSQKKYVSIPPPPSPHTHTPKKQVLTALHALAQELEGAALKILSGSTQGPQFPLCVLSFSRLGNAHA